MCKDTYLSAAHKFTEGKQFSFNYFHLNDEKYKKSLSALRRVLLSLPLGGNGRLQVYAAN